ncbi:MAG: ribosomal protein S18-alanine N-acetyltransferase [Nitrospiraceae bacterium]|nr:MAG: ribosomal protein S18-alanine N-acetyltransferase [Nitrospiraceae bacterium]
MEGIKIRAMRQGDIGPVYQVAQLSFSAPWNPPSFEYELNNRDAIIRVAVLNRKIAGYVCLRTILDVTHVMDLAVHPKLRRSGIGSMLLKSALQQLRRTRQDVRHVTLEVRESNIAAIGLYEKFGFGEIGRRKEYYKKPPEDAVIMELDMDGTGFSFTVH